MIGEPIRFTAFKENFESHHHLGLQVFSFILADLIIFYCDYFSQSNIYKFFKKHISQETILLCEFQVYIFFLEITSVAECVTGLIRTGHSPPPPPPPPQVRLSKETLSTADLVWLVVQLFLKPYSSFISLSAKRLDLLIKQYFC